tara:strand:+ start:60 stop:236 length:177 start_codon:yes stop_codon:yes gene_type:complete
MTAFLKEEFTDNLEAKGPTFVEDTPPDLNKPNFKQLENDRRSSTFQLPQGVKMGVGAS